MKDESRLLLRVDEVAQLLGLSRSKTYEMLASGELPSISLGRARRIPVRALEMFVEARLGNQRADM